MAKANFGLIPDSVFELVPEIGYELGRVDSMLDYEYPHIADKIIKMWGSEELSTYLEDLLDYNYTIERPKRKGFPFYVLNEINVIIKTHNRKFPQYKTAKKIDDEDVWGSRPDRNKKTFD